MRERLLGLVVWLAAILVTVQLAIAAAGLTWHLAGETADARTDFAVETGDVQDDRPTDLGPVLALAPFGTEPPAAAPEPDAEETALGLALHGVVVSTPAAASMAFIAEEGGEVRSYGIGDIVAREVTLEEVRPDMVLLRTDDRLETLSFPEASANRGVAGVLAKLPQSVSSAATSDEPDAVIDRWRQRIAANPQTVLDGLGLAATPEGYRIMDEAAPSVRRAGFRPGDVVASVNGVKVGDVEADRRLFEEIAASGQARVEVMRDGKKITMSFPLR